MIITIIIPKDTKLLVKSGQTVDFDTPLVEKHLQTDIKISIDKKLGIKPDKIFHYLQKFVGETVEKDEVLAFKKGVFLSKKVISNYKGIVKEINHNDGMMLIACDVDEKKYFPAYFKGEITEIINGSELRLKVKEAKEYEAKNISDDFGAQVFYYKKGADLNSANINCKIVVAKEINPFEQIKIEALGGKGFVTLNKIPNMQKLPNVQFKKIEDFDHAVKNNFPYCLIQKSSSKIYFYT